MPQCTVKPALSPSQEPIGIVALHGVNSTRTHTKEKQNTMTHNTMIEYIYSF